MHEMFDNFKFYEVFKHYIMYVPIHKYILIIVIIEYFGNKVLFFLNFPIVFLIVCTL